MNADASRATRSLLLVIALAVAGAVTPAAPVSAAADWGSISGILTDHGAPVAFADVEADGIGEGGGRGFTDESGRYVIDELPAGAYRISFRAAGHFKQWAHGKTSSATASRIVVVAGHDTKVNESLLDGATIQGRFADAAGTGVAARVVALTEENGARVSVASEDGTFRLTVLPGTYRIQFELGVKSQWAYGARSWDAAQPFVLSSIGQTVTVNETMLPTGRVAGRFTDGGKGMAGISVQLESAQHDLHITTTDSRGDYSLDGIFAGAYKVHFFRWVGGPVLDQWAYGKVDKAGAATITVVAGATTTVNDTKLPTGSVRVTAKDSMTGAPISSFTAHLAHASASTTNGVVVFNDVPMGRHRAMMDAEGYRSALDVPVIVTAGKETALVVTLEPYSKIMTTVLDAATGSPVAGVCVFPNQPQLARVSGGCAIPGSTSDADGRVTVTLPEAGSYQLFALPIDAPGYGGQWVGAAGGTGDQRAARLTSVARGITVTVPPIRLDRSGVIEGRVTSRTGKALRWASVGVFPGPFNAGDGSGTALVDSEGDYRIDFLGPYRWPLMFVAKYHATQWSGAVSNRFEATTVQVTAGRTVTYNYKLRQGRPVTFTISDRIEGGDVVAHDAVTGDYLSFGRCAAGDPSVPLWVLSDEAIKIGWFDGNTWEWFGGSDFAGAYAFVIRRPFYTISLDYPSRPVSALKRGIGPGGAPRTA